jgi:hypothetical protein
MLACLFSASALWAGDPSEIIEWDLGYLSPVGIDLGAAWGPSHWLEFYGQGSFILFRTGTEYDQTFGENYDLPGFFAYALAVRWRRTWGAARYEQWSNKAFVGVAIRDFAASAEGDALDCLYCSTTMSHADFPANLYLETGFRRGALLAGLSVRLTDNRGSASSWGWDPYGVGGEWDLEWDGLQPPAFIVHLAVTRGF